LTGIEGHLSIFLAQSEVLLFFATPRRSPDRKFADYYHRSRTHLGLQKDTPESRPAQHPDAGRIVAIPEVGGLHHRYELRAA
jgi:hypothetical protein